MSPAAADPLLGQQIEGYRITRSIGHGGMGMIYEAVHPGIGQRAAIKVLFPTFSRDEDAVSRFVAEARAASRVRHPGLVKIWSHGRMADGTAYIMMEYLGGESLQARLSRLKQTAERMPLPEVLRIAAQVASALAAVHREGIVHRDLKPANLLSFADPEAHGGERIKVVDFGIAKFLSGSTSEVGKTTVGKFLGTALYASPEQCQMAGRVGPMADVYALGVILYELLAGRPPFFAEHPGVVIAMHLSHRPRPLWEVRRGLPTPLCRLVHEMLRKDPEQRPSMEHIGSRLAALRLDAAEWPFRLWRRKGTLAAALGAALLTGIFLRSQHPVRAGATLGGRGESRKFLPASTAAVPALLTATGVTAELPTPGATAGSLLPASGTTPGSLLPASGTRPASLLGRLERGRSPLGHALRVRADPARGRVKLALAGRGKPGAGAAKPLLGGPAVPPVAATEDAGPPPPPMGESAPAAMPSVPSAPPAELPPRPTAPPRDPPRPKESGDEDEAFH